LKKDSTEKCTPWDPRGCWQIRILN
jgi:hypothetical protein